MALQLQRVKDAERTLGSLVAVNVAVWAAWQLKERWMVRHFTVSYPAIQRGRYWTLLSSAISHQDLSHLANNMLSLYLFGQPLHVTIGRTRFLLLYITAGLLSNLTWLKINGRRGGSALGASGAVSGIITMLSMLQPLRVLTIGSVRVVAILYALLFFGVEFWQTLRQEALRAAMRWAISSSPSSYKDGRGYRRISDRALDEAYDAAFDDHIAHTAHW